MANPLRKPELREYNRQEKSLGGVSEARLWLEDKEAGTRFVHREE